MDGSLRVAGSALLLACCPAAAPPASAEPLPAPDFVAIDRWVEAFRAASGLPHVAVAIVADGEARATAYGATSDGVPSVDSPILLGSVTKTFTALAVAQLVDAGRLGFDDPVARHLPRFVLADRRASEMMTVRQLLTHTSGFSQWSGHDRRAQALGDYRHLAPVRTPGTVHEYSSLNYMILGDLIEAVSGLEYACYLEREIFEPLEMRSSFAAPPEREPGDRWLRGNRFLFGWSFPSREPEIPRRLVPAGFVAASARDLGRYLTMLLDGGEYRSRRIVSRQSLSEIWTPWDGAPTGAGMAWGVGRTRIGHAGSTRTSSARILLLPAGRRAVAVLVDANSGPFLAASSDLAEGVLRALEDKPLPAVRPRERWLKLGLLALLLANLLSLGMHWRRWRRRGSPIAWPRRARHLVPIGAEIAISLVALVGVPRWFGVPLSTIVDYFPDLGAVILVGVATGLPGGLLRTWVRAGAERSSTSGTQD